jgi:CHAT domain-containing protein/tetratricopeptide (TPR) repeat protein
MARRLFSIVSLVLAAAISLAAPALARGSDAAAVEKRFLQYFSAGDYAAALVEAQNLEPLIRAQAGTRSVNYVIALSHLAEGYMNLERYREAEPIYRQAIPIIDSIQPANPNLSVILHSEFGTLLQNTGRPADAERELQQALAKAERMPDLPQATKFSVFENLGGLLFDQGRYREAEEIYRRALALYEGTPANEHTAASLQNLANVFVEEGRFADAETLYKRALAMREQVLGPNHKQVAQNLLNWGALLVDAEGRSEEAIPLYQRALSILQKVLGTENDDYAMTLNNLAAAYRNTGRPGDSEKLQLQALAIQERVLGPNNRDVALSLYNLGTYYAAQGRFEEAERLQRRSIAALESGSGPDNPYIARSLSSLGDIFEHQGKYAEAKAAFEKALSIRETAFGEGHPLVADSLEDLARVESELGLTASALAHARKATALLLADAAVVAPNQTQAGGSVLIQNYSNLFRRHAVTLALATEAGLILERDAGREAFEAVQWSSQSSSAAALTQMGLRSAAGNSALAALVRENQDLLAAWSAKDKALTAALSIPAAQGDRSAVGKLRDEIAVIESSLAALAVRLQQQFPDYAALANPKPIGIDAVQKLLAGDEAIVLIFDFDETVRPAPAQTFIWAVNKTDFRWVRSRLDTKALAREVKSLRCGLDTSPWEPSRGLARPQSLQAAAASSGEASCQELLGATAQEGMLPFDLARSHRLYKELFGQVEDLIAGKKLLIVPSGPLAALPFQVLVTEKPAAAIPHEAAAYAKAKWLGTVQPLTVLPSVASLKALRRHAGNSAAPGPYFGFGNPLLTGASGSDRSAWAVQSCTALGTGGRTLVASARGLARPFTELYKPGGAPGAADIEALRRQPPLPDTADELCAVARLAGAGPDSVYLGAQATETRVAALSAQGALARVRILHFATHGLVAGEVKEFSRALKAEPALLLTPPERVTGDDDGLLTASKVAALKLDADWVILSACNTAAGGDKGGEALSGLARAFFYAGARALLVSHWYVDSAAAVELVTQAFGEMQSHPGIGRAEAMRRAMASLITRGDRSAHPSVWAPFAVVGEGGAAAAR